MALTGGQIPVSGYQTPDYSGAAQAGGALGAIPSQMVSGFIEDYKDLAKKDKEMSSRIKGTITLLDNAKGIYADFAPQIENMKSQLSDPSLSNTDKVALSEQVGNSLNMFAQYGTEGVKNKLAEAQILQTNAEIARANAQTEAAGRTPMTGVVDGKVVEGYGDLRTGTFTPFTRSNQPSSTLFRATAFGGGAYDPTTRKEIESGQFAKMGGDEKVGSGGIPYVGIGGKTPTIATKKYPAGTRLMVKSSLYPDGREHIVAGTGPADPNVLDFYGANKKEYDALASQKLYDVQVIDGKTQAISDAAGIQSNTPAPEPNILIKGIQGVIDYFTPDRNISNQTPTSSSDYIEAVSKTDNYRAATPKEAAAQGATFGQINERTGQFFPTKQQRGTITRLNPETGAFEIIEGPGVTDKAANAANAAEKMQGESLRLNQANTEEAFSRLDKVGTDNAIFASGNALLAKALPASEAGEMKSFLERVNAENSFERMRALRASSPTGGGAGSMTEQEWPRFEGRFFPLKVDAKRETLTKGIGLNLLNAFEAVNGTPEDVIKKLDKKEIDQATFDNYVQNYISNRKIARVKADGFPGESNKWTKLNKALLSRSSVFESPSEMTPQEKRNAEAEAEAEAFRRQLEGAP
jgi:hypothetical protein